MGVTFLVWLVLLSFCRNKPGLFGCLFVLLLAGILFKGCAG